MSGAVDQLEKRVNAVVDLVRHLRREVARLEHELADRPAPPPSPVSAPSVSPDERLLEEISRLRDERTAARERVRALIREIDQVSW